MQSSKDPGGLPLGRFHLEANCRWPPEKLGSSKFSLPQPRQPSRLFSLNRELAPANLAYGCSGGNGRIGGARYPAATPVQPQEGRVACATS